MSSCYICGEGVIEIAAASVQPVGLSDSAQRLLKKRRLHSGSAAAIRTFAQCDSCIAHFGRGAALARRNSAATPVVKEYHRLCNTQGGGDMAISSHAIISSIVSPQGVPSPLHHHISIDEGIWALYRAAIAAIEGPTTTSGGEDIDVVSPQARLTSWKMKSLLSLRHPSVRLEPTTPASTTEVEQPYALRLVALSAIEQGTTIDLSSVPHDEEDIKNSVGAPIYKKMSDVLVNPSTPMSNYMTHSCTPNTQLLGLQPTERTIERNKTHEEDDQQITSSSSYIAAVVVALRDITPNEPLTIDTEALPPYFKAASIGLRQEELLRRRTIRKAMHMDRGYHLTRAKGDYELSTQYMGNCQCEACVGDALLPELLIHNGGNSSESRLNTTAFQRILIKEGVVVVGQDAPQCSSAQQVLTPIILEKMVCGNVLRYDFSRSFACPLSPLCKEGVVYPSSTYLTVSGASNNIINVVVWRCDSCLEWWVVNKDALHSALSPTIRSIVRFEEQAIGKAKEALSTIKMLHSGYVPIAEVLPLLSQASGGDVEDVRRRAMASLHYMEEMGNKPLTNKCYTALKDLLQSCVDAGMVMEVTPRESSFDNLQDRNHSSAVAVDSDGGISANNDAIPHIQSRCSHWVYSSACLYMSLYFSELGTKRLKGEGEQEAALAYAVRWMKLYLRSMLPLSWVGNNESGGSSLLWNRSKIAAGGAAMTLARAIRRFPRQYANAKYLTVFAYVSGYVTMKMALSRSIAAGNDTIINFDTVEFIKSHNAVQIPEIKEIEALLVSSSITTTTPSASNNISKPVAVSPTERKGQVWYWLHHGETGFGGAQDDSSTSATGGGAETHEEVLKDWEEYLMELSREAMTRQQNPNLPPEVVQAMRGLGR